MNLLLSTDYADLPHDQWPEITTRQESKDRGWKFYFTGKPCKYGHMTFRYVAVPNCQICNNYYNEQYRKTDLYKRKALIRGRKHEATEKRKKYHLDPKTKAMKNRASKKFRDTEKGAKSRIGEYWRRIHGVDLPESLLDAMYAQLLVKRELKKLRN